VRNSVTATTKPVVDAENDLLIAGLKYVSTGTVSLAVTAISYPGC
jgi:hypothetical protein